MLFKLKLRIKTKILIMLLGLSFIYLILFGYIMFNGINEAGKYAIEKTVFLGDEAIGKSIPALKKQAEEYLSQKVQDQAALINEILQDVEHEVNTMTEFAALIWNDTLPTETRVSYSQHEKPEDISQNSVYVLAPNVTFDAVSEDLNRSGRMDDIFKPIYNNNPNLHCIYFSTESGIHRRYPWYSGYAPSFDHRNRPWYQQSVKSGAITWTEPYISASSTDLMVTCAKAVYNNPGELLGVIGADVTLRTIKERILNAEGNDLRYAFLIKPNGNVIFRPDLSAEDKRWDDTYKTENFLQNSNLTLRKIASEMAAGNTGVAICLLEDEEKYIAYAPLAATGWSVGIVVPVAAIIAPALAAKKEIAAIAKITERTINEDLKRSIHFYIIIFIAIIFISGCIVYKFSQQITKPIIALSEGAKIIGGGNLDYQLKVKTGDEIEDLAQAFNKMTDNLRVYIKNLRETTAVKERIENELKIAREIQITMLPRKFPPFPERNEFSLFALMDPAKEVGGDFFDFFFIDKNRLCVLIGDISGKGVPAALFMAVSKTVLILEAMRGNPPEEVLSRVNNLLFPSNDSCMFFTGLCVILNTETGDVQIANGGHNPPLVYSGGLDFEYLNLPKGFVVGAMGNINFQSRSLALKPDNILFLYTDGVTEAVNKKNEMFSEKRLKKCLSALKEKEVTEIIQGVKREIEDYIQGMPQADDITMLALKFKGKGG